MPRRTRLRRTPTEEWQQLSLWTTGPEHWMYELLRPVVLFGQSPAERSRQTMAPERSIRRKAARFDEIGMLSLFETSTEPRPHDRRSLPPPLRQKIVDLRAEYPGLRLREIATICYVTSGRRPSPHTVQRVLAEGPPPSRHGRRYPPYTDSADPVEARLAIIRVHAEGWTVTSIAAYLQTSRPTVYATLRRWVEEGVPGLDDKPHTRKRLALKTDLHALVTVRRLQENSGLGAFRIHAALRQLGIRLSPRTCGRILALNRHLYGLNSPKREPHEKKEMPFAAQRRHQYWTTDIRYLDAPHLAEKVYVISILENFSRAILASAVSPMQDTQAYLSVLRAAVSRHGAPEAIVSDGGGVFKAKAATIVYRLLGITKEQIARRQPWMSYIETAFNVQRRMADYHFAQAESWPELRAVHDRYVADYNYQVHWAHRARADGARSPAEVLGWIHGIYHDESELHRVFQTARSGRRVDGSGYVRYRHWRLYGERGLAGRHASIWLYAETITIEYDDEPLAQYGVRLAPDKHHLMEVTEPRLFENRFPSPQPFLEGMSAVAWHLIMRRPPYKARRKSAVIGIQERLFD